MTEMTFFERLYLVPGVGTFVLSSTVPMHAQPRPFIQQLFLDFRANFEWHLNFFFCESTFTEITE